MVNTSTLCIQVKNSIVHSALFVANSVRSGSGIMRQGGYYELIGYLNYIMAEGTLSSVYNYVRYLIGNKQYMSGLVYNYENIGL